MPTYLVTALVALGGAIIGALAAAVTQLWIERARAKRDTAAREREVRTAARMMITDLSRAMYNITYTRQSSKWWPTPGLQSRVSDSDRRLVIGDLSPDGVYDVDQAEGEIELCYGLREEFLKIAVSIPSETIDRLQRALDSIDRAIIALRVLAGGTRPPDDRYRRRPTSPSEGFEDNG